VGKRKRKKEKNACNLSPSWGEGEQKGLPLQGEKNGVSLAITWFVLTIRERGSKLSVPEAISEEGEKGKNNRKQE